MKTQTIQVTIQCDDAIVVNGRNLATRMLSTCDDDFVVSLASSAGLYSFDGRETFEFRTIYVFSPRMKTHDGGRYLGITFRHDFSEIYLIVPGTSIRHPVTTEQLYDELVGYASVPEVRV